MFGAEMLLKSLGLDPEEIKNSIAQFGAMVVAIKESLDRIEAKQDEILSRLNQKEIEHHGD